MEFSEENSLSDFIPILPKTLHLIQVLAALSENAIYYKTSSWTLIAGIKLLKPVLDELQEKKKTLDAATLSALERIESTLVKAEELLERCSGHASIFQMVLQKQRILRNFQDVSLELHSVLCSLPQDCFELSEQSHQQFEQCVEDLQGANYSSDILEEELAEDIWLALKEIQGGVKMNHQKLAELAGRFDLKSNQEILKEASFLEKEKNIARLDKDKVKEESVNLLIDLITQMAEDLAEQKQAQVVMGGIPIPADFRCPLSLELMSDPVIVASGQTYERAYIQQWLDQGNTACPKTRQVLSHKNLIPNYTVKALIANWCEENNVPLPEPEKLETASIQPLGGKNDGKYQESTQQSEAASRSHSDRAVAAIGGRPSGRSVQTVRARAHEDFDMDRREARPPVSSVEETKRTLGFGDINGPRQTMLSREGDHFLDGSHGHSRNTSISSRGSSTDDVLAATTMEDNNQQVPQSMNDSSPYSSDISGELERLNVSSRSIFVRDEGSPAGGANGVWTSYSRRSVDGDSEMGRTGSLSDSGAAGNGSNDMQHRVETLVEDLRSSSLDAKRNAASELRLLAKYNMENRIIIANSGVIMPLVSLLQSTDYELQENAVTALLNLSINDNNKHEIAAAGAIDPLVNVLKVGTSIAKENAAATLFSLSVMDENKVSIGQSGAILPLVDLLMNGTSRGKKDAATALFNLSILHENKARIVRANAVRPLVELMSDPAAGMVDKAVAVLGNLATIQEGRFSIGEEEGIPALVEVLELGSQRGKENAAAALLHLCTSNNRFRAKVLQEGAIPPLVALSQSGTARAKEKASALLRHFRDQRHGGHGRGGGDRHADRHF